jgi:aminoglycoside phosphotransferase (APT) family kinase protein
MTDTAPIREEERFDEAGVARYLGAVVDGLEPPITFRQFPGGKANLTYLAVDATGSELVLRRPPLGEVAPGAHDMAREHRVLSVLWRSFPKAPRALAFCDDPSVMGKPFFVMERRHGSVIRDGWPFPDEERRTVTATSLIDTLAELHLVDYEALGLDDLGRPEGFVERQVAGWTDRWQRAKTRDLVDMTTAAASLADPPIAQKTVLLHNDFKLDNTMVDDRGAVTSVFDWDMATLGDPLVDVGTALAYWADADSPTAGVFGADAALLAPYLSADDAAARYSAASGVDVTDLPYYVGLAYFRIAVIVEQIYARFAAGQTTDRRFEGLGALVPVLATAAADSLRQR